MSASSLYLLLSAFLAVFIQLQCFAQDSSAGAVPPSQTQGNAAGKKELIRLEPTLDVLEESQPADAKPITFAPGKQVKLSGGVIEKNLIIEWDDWHNKFAQAVASRMFNNFIEAINMPHGAYTWYHCEITSDKHIKAVRITKSSGSFWYDKSVIQAVYKLEGSDILAFPSNSQRTEISTDLGIVMGGERKGYMKFGDLEYHQFTKDPPRIEPPPSAPAAEDDRDKHKHKHRRHKKQDN